jgi:flagellar motor protein MotB
MYTIRRKTAVPWLAAIALLMLSFRADADGLPGEYLLSSRWRDMMSRHSPLNNPSFLSREQRVALRGAFASTMQGAFTLWESGVTLPIDARHSAGLTIIGENDGEIHGAAFDPDANRLTIADNTLSNDNYLIMASYALVPWKQLSAGLNANIAYQTNFGDPVMGVGFDLGASCPVLRHPLAGSHTAGISTLNLLAPSMRSGPRPELDHAGSYSRGLRLSWLADIPRWKAESGLDIDFRDFWADAEEFTTGDASEALKKMEWGIGWRGGIWLFDLMGVFGQLGFDRRVLEYWGLATGVKVALPQTEIAPRVFYQYNIKTEGDWASAHTLYLFAEFGQSRRQSRKERSESSPSPMKYAGRDQGQEAINDLRRIKGLQVEDEDEFVRITAEEVAVHFASGSAEIPQSALSTLKKIADFMRTYGERPVSIEGHTDNDPIVGRLAKTYPTNKDLSEARCRSVKRYFVETEQLPERLFTIKGWGESKPIAPNETERGKYRNRRVVITIEK